MILPGATLGMLGGGQLGRMFTIAARTMGYRVIVLDPDPDSPAGRMADEHLHAAYTDEWALEQLGRECAAVTTEFENVPAATLRLLATRCPVRPAAAALEICQDRIREKSFIREHGLATSPFYVVKAEADLVAAMQALTPPLVLKSSVLGYDGKGQRPVGNLRQAPEAFHALGGKPCVLEQRIDLAAEISVVLARSPTGEAWCFPVAENEHIGGILHCSIVPARVTDTLQEQARAMALALAEALDYCGVMAVEFFIDSEGNLLVNELAPRPHNSGHYTLDACVTSQFEQQVRMVCGLPAGDTRLLSPVTMVNLLGDIWTDSPPDWGQLFARPGAKLHLYGKSDARPGRKMGHYCYLDGDPDHAARQAEELLERLSMRPAARGLP